MRALKNAVRLLVAWLASGRFVDLISTRNHTAYLARDRLHAVVTRTRLVAGAFSVLTLLWIVFDSATLSADHLRVLATCRALAAIVLALVALAPEHEHSEARALTMLGIILALPLAIYGVSQSLFLGAPLNGLAAINSSFYRGLPAIVLGGLSIFPLVAAEGLFFAVMIALVVAGVQLVLVGVPVLELLSMLWVLTLAMGVYLLACAFQLNYMMALLRRASHDPLTGALTRRSGVEVLDLYFRLSRDQDTPLSVLFLDADNFKSINDGFGHEAGDQALKDIVATLHALKRQSDVVIRWGGEEFVVLLTNTPVSGARLVVDRILRDWLGARPDGAPLTASIGIAERKTDAATDWSALIALADERMYAAKQAGKASCVDPEGHRTGTVEAAAAFGIG
jgi:diguanylate cyclase (GGDEF)-like protein